MRQGIYIKGEADILFLGLENGLAAGDTSVVDEHGWVPNFSPDLLGHSLDLLDGSDVALVVIHIVSYILYCQSCVLESEKEMVD